MLGKHILSIHQLFLFKTKKYKEYCQHLTLPGLPCSMVQLNDPFLQKHATKTLTNMDNFETLCCQFAIFPSNTRTLVDKTHIYVKTNKVNYNKLLAVRMQTEKQVLEVVQFLDELPGAQFLSKSSQNCFGLISFIPQSS